MPGPADTDSKDYHVNYGDFAYHGHFNPCGFMPRNCALFQDDDGAA